MFEVYTGTKPGRPTVLLLLTAGALTGTLGLAWAQVRGSLALGDEVRISGTPLVVRPPKGWVQSPDDPRVFGKWIRKRTWWRRQVWAAERTIEFRHNDYLSQFTRLFQLSGVSRSRPARIGEWAGVQFEFERRGRQGVTETVYRVVSTAVGGQISVEYTPLAEVSHGDLALLDTVCEAVRLTGDVPRPSARDVLDYVGVDFPVPRGWEILGSQDLNGPGLWLQNVEEGHPVCALGVARRYLRGRGSGKDLLAAEARAVLSRFARLGDGSRDDGVYVGVARDPDAVRGSSVFVSVWVVVKSRNEAAVVYVLAEPGRAEAAGEAAAELVDGIEFVAEFPR